ncbi:hypothetical protein C1S99_08095 [Vibrio parahaemolyticus]|uniref:hypothetical protein n=1 Tax=Vibrio parahaemolyticus TaxID=670 RepID=UPI000C86A2D2|nr:hypothetical protein [Vibrio parahaemolyticus]EJE4178517.1 hypothetical protein [Vibrio parahaemolyticus]MCX8816034.1 hypothetical protein [Vibrio parahaemolyticus]MDG2564394.1 hypothetical protein [Vibrio parahaemolyticus]PMS43829.1 hypothetical protein C1T12_00185 [Vibrio parahaemolyticus]PMS64219.1 hypothetical protein C1S91_00185 [Vibrio parahaemolyticus]
MARKNNLGCDYQGSHFGAWYEDACCCDGYLWDLDSGGIDDAGNSYLDHGGDIPCPQCHTKQYVKSYMADEYESDGYASLDHPLSAKGVKNALSYLPSNRRRMAMRFWRAGRRQAVKEAMRGGY